MKKVILFLTFIWVVLSGSESYKTTSYLMMTKSYGAIAKDNASEEKSTLDKIVLNFDTLYLNSDNKLVSSINYTGISGYGYNNKYKMDIGSFDVINVTNLYYSRFITENFLISIGIFNFKSDGFTTESLYNKTNGIGMYGLVDFELEGLLATYKSEHCAVTFGTISKGKYTHTAFVLPTNDHVSESERVLEAFDGSDGYALLYNTMLNKNLRLDFNYYYYNEKLLHLSKKRLNLVGLGLQYDNVDVTGETAYAMISLSDTKGDASNLAILNETYSNIYYDKYKTSGYSVIIGYNKIFDNSIFKRSVKLGFEGKYISEGYDSISVGVPISLNNSAAIGYTGKVYSVITVNKDFLIKLMYCNYFNGTGTTTMVHGVPVTNKIDEDMKGATNLSAISLGFIYRF